jgi:hypothetical protein
MKRDCDLIKNLLNPYIDNELQSKDKIIVEEHLAECESCSKELNSLIKVSKIVKGANRFSPPDSEIKKLKMRFKSEKAFKPKHIIYNIFTYLSHNRLTLFIASGSAILIIVVALILIKQNANVVRIANKQDLKLNYERTPSESYSAAPTKPSEIYSGEYKDIYKPKEEFKQNEAPQRSLEIKKMKNKVSKELIQKNEEAKLSPSNEKQLSSELISEDKCYKEKSEEQFPTAEIALKPESTNSIEKQKSPKDNIAEEKRSEIESYEKTKASLIPKEKLAFKLPNSSFTKYNLLIEVELTINSETNQIATKLITPIENEELASIIIKIIKEYDWVNFINNEQLQSKYFILKFKLSENIMELIEIR